MKVLQQRRRNHIYPIQISMSLLSAIRKPSFMNNPDMYPADHGFSKKFMRIFPAALANLLFDACIYAAVTSCQIQGSLIWY